MRPSGPAAFRLQLSQSFNGVASFSGPLIASKYFFSGGNESNLTNVQFVYMAVAGLGAALALAFIFTRLPEVSEAELQAEADEAAEALAGSDTDGQLAKPFYKQTRPILGFIAQFAYVGAQVTVGTFFINYAHESAGYTDAAAANLLSYALITFTVFRFIATALLTVFSAPLLLAVAAAVSALLIAIIGSIHGTGGVIALIILYATMSLQYPVIFVISTENLGRHTRAAAALLVMGVAGGAVFPPAQGAIADGHGTRVSMWLSFPAFLYVAAFATWVWIKKGRKVMLQAELAWQAEQLVGHAGVRDVERPAASYEEKGDASKIETSQLEYVRG